MSQYEILSLQIEERNFWLAVIVAIISFISALVVYLDYRSRKKKERAEKSIQIAEKFAKEIIDPLSTILAFFNQTGLSEIINKVKFSNFFDFDNEELNDLFSAEDISQYNELINKYDEKHKMRNLISETLNELEALCMYISTHVADEKYIYNSLHQQFLKSISQLYISISLSNTDNKDKYFTNIIQVFNIWKSKYIKAANKEKNIKKKLKPKISKIK